MNRVLTLILACSSVALAGQDSGVIANWNAFSSSMARSPQVLAPHKSDPAGNMARGIISNGRFSLTFDDRAAARAAEAAPRCGNVVSTPGLRVTLLVGLLVKSGTSNYRLTREQPSGDMTVRDVYVWADRPGVVKGQCTESDTTARYNLRLASGWNVVRLSTTATGNAAIMGNLPGPALAWRLGR